MNDRQPTSSHTKWRRPSILVLVLLLTTAAFWVAFSDRGFLFRQNDRVWQAIQDRGTWRVGMDPSFPPFEYLDESGRPVGFDVDLAQAIADRLGVEVDLVSIGFDGLTDAVQVGEVDSVISALPYDPRLTQDIRYSESYFEAGTRLVVPSDSPISSTEELAGTTVAVEWGSVGDAEARRLRRDMPTIQRAPYPSPSEAMASLLDGESDALIVDGVTLRLAQGAGNPVKAVGPPLEGDPYVVAMPSNAQTLQARINQTLDEFRADGTLAAIEQRWFNGSSD